jgi:asparagine synthetase B (glutamine-hydrolysing)
MCLYHSLILLYKYKRILKRDFYLYKEELNYDINTLIWQNIENCEILLASSGLEFMIPYLDVQLIKSVRGINPKYLIGSEKKVDKIVLREIARSEGLPKHLYKKKKSALQYSSRIHHVLDSFLRQIGFTKKLSLDLGYGNKYRELFLDYIRYKINYPSKLTHKKFEKIVKILKNND